MKIEYVRYIYSPKSFDWHVRSCSQVRGSLWSTTYLSMPSMIHLLSCSLSFSLSMSPSNPTSLFMCCAMLIVASSHDISCPVISYRVIFRRVLSSCFLSYPVSAWSSDPHSLSPSSFFTLLPSLVFFFLYFYGCRLVLRHCSRSLLNVVSKI